MKICKRVFIMIQITSISTAALFLVIITALPSIIFIVQVFPEAYLPIKRYLRWTFPDNSLSSSEDTVNRSLSSRLPLLL